MKYILFIQMLLLSLPVISAGENATMHVDSIRSDGDSVSIAIHSDAKYWVGGERYCLTIDGQTFVKSQHAYKDDMSILTFNLSLEAFNNTANNSEVVLSYGELSESSPQWELGVLDKSMLNK